MGLNIHLFRNQDLYFVNLMVYRSNELKRVSFSTWDSVNVQTIGKLLNCAGVSGSFLELSLPGWPGLSIVADHIKYGQDQQRREQ